MHDDYKERESDIISENSSDEYRKNIIHNSNSIDPIAINIKVISDDADIFASDNSKRFASSISRDFSIFKSNQDECVKCDSNPIGEAVVLGENPDFTVNPFSKFNYIVYPISNNTVPFGGGAIFQQVPEDGALAERSLPGHILLLYGKLGHRSHRIRRNACIEIRQAIEQLPRDEQKRILQELARRTSALRIAECIGQLLKHFNDENGVKIILQNAKTYFNWQFIEGLIRIFMKEYPKLIIEEFLWNSWGELESQKAYATDLTDAQWALIEPLMPPRQGRRRGRIRQVDLREVVNAILYLNLTGCGWRHIPHDFPNWSTISDYYHRFRRDGTWNASTTCSAITSANKRADSHRRASASWTANRSKPPKKGGERF